MIIGLPFVILIIFPNMLSINYIAYINNLLVTIQQWLIHLTTTQILIHSKKGHTWKLILILLIICFGLTNLLDLLPHSFTPTAQLSMNLGIAFPLLVWAHSNFWLLTWNQSTLAHFLLQGTPIPFIFIFVILKTISLFMQPIVLAVQLTANITADHLLIHLMGEQPQL